MSSKESLAKISAFIKARRRETGLGLRATAEQCGLSPSTMSRLERGISTSLPDETLKKLASWLRVPVDTLIFEKVRRHSNREPELSTAEAVEVHLRADKKLSPKTAEALAQMFRMLYDQLTETQERDAKK
jgi:transcriptional regulator with XRE-family HTH domain